MFEIVAGGIRLLITTVIPYGNQLIIYDATSCIGGYIDELVLGERRRLRVKIFVFLGLLIIFNMGYLLATYWKLIGQVIFDEFAEIEGC